MFIDTHAHLQWRNFDMDRDAVLERAIENEVSKIINIGFDLEGSLKGVRLSEEYPQMFATVGIHPHSAKEFNKNVENEMKNLVEKSKVIGIGEIGLDYFRNLSPQSTQREAFESQLKMAEELDVPVIIHDREAHQDIIRILQEFSGKIKGVMHCFSGDYIMAQKCVKMGFYISFAGPITYPKNIALHETAKKIDPNFMLLETDCPWLSPQEKRGKRNEPGNIPIIAKKLAELRNEPIELIKKITTENAQALFGL